MIWNVFTKRFFKYSRFIQQYQSAKAETAFLVLKLLKNMVETIRSWYNKNGFDMIVDYELIPEEFIKIKERRFLLNKISFF